VRENGGGIGMVLRDQNDNHYWLTQSGLSRPFPGLTGRADEILVFLTSERAIS